ncbi:MAG: hypothetical protein NTY38_29365 [Acidobacteria bacterium]|nr:hypothetical protein [Acidobacteriota bacterium]
MALKTSKAHYTEVEAAEALGVSTDQLRLLIKRHIADAETDIRNVSIASFQPSDVLLLRILANRFVSQAGTD